MHRREFLEKSLKFLITGAIALKTGGYGKIFALDNEKYDLVSVTGENIKKMFEEGIKFFGGIEKFVKRGMTVVVKPNIGWNAPPERAANTNPELVGEIVKSCLKAGAKKVFVFDHTCDPWQKTYTVSGIKDAVEKAGGKILSANMQKDYVTAKIPMAKSLKSAKVFKLFLDADCVINVPILKDHRTTELTIGLKNLMGVVWDRWWWHANNLNQCIADFLALRKPDLTVIDAYRVLIQNGPRGISENDVIKKNTIIISKDSVAADAAACKLLNKIPEQIKHIQLAYEKNLGEINLKNLKIKRIVL